MAWNILGAVGKFVGNAHLENIVTGLTWGIPSAVLNKIWDASKEKFGQTAADAVTNYVRDEFSHDYTDEEYYNQAWATLSLAERETLTRRVATLKTDAQRNNYRKAVIVFAWEGPADKQTKKYDPVQTSKTLKAIAETSSDKAWRDFIKSNNLHKPPAPKRIMLLITRGKPWFRRAGESYSTWSKTQAEPKLNAIADRIRNSTPAGNAQSGAQTGPPPAPRQRTKFTWEI